MRGARYTAMATQLPFTVIGGYGLGYGLDYLFGTTWLRIVFLFVGIIGGLSQIVVQVMRDAKNK